LKSTSAAWRPGQPRSPGAGCKIIIRSRSVARPAAAAPGGRGRRHSRRSPCRSAALACTRAEAARLRVDVKVVALEQPRAALRARARELDVRDGGLRARPRRALAVHVYRRGWPLCHVLPQPGEARTLMSSQIGAFRLVPSEAALWPAEGAGRRGVVCVRPLRGDGHSWTACCAATKSRQESIQSMHWSVAADSLAICTDNSNDPHVAWVVSRGA